MRFGVLKKRLWKSKTRKIVAVMAVFLMFMPGALAANESTSINWTYMSDLVSGVAGLFPSFVTLIVNAVPILIILAVVGFIVGFFDKILDAISSAGRMFK
jgi:hypothetical protein